MRSWILGLHMKKTEIKNILEAGWQDRREKSQRRRLDHALACKDYNNKIKPVIPSTPAAAIHPNPSKQAT